MSTRPRLTFQTARVVFYDVEALPNVFTVASFDPWESRLHIFHLVDGPLGDQFNLAIRDRVSAQIRHANPALPAGTAIRYHDLRTHRGNRNLALMLGMFAGARVNPARPAPGTPPLDAPTWDDLDSSYRPVCDTDPDYDPRHHPLLAGYNSRYYDTTILARYLEEAFAATRQDITSHHRLASEDPGQVAAAGAGPRFVPTTAATMARHNNALFTDEFRQRMPTYLTRGSVAANIRQAMINSGRHIDISGFNEGVIIGLKRVQAGLGRQVLEFGDFQTVITTIDDLIRLIAYNASDVVGLAAVAEHPTFAATFDLKAGLLDSYPECTYEFGKPRNQYNVRGWRLTLDSTAAQFAARILAPDQALPDLPAVSFWYPETHVAQQKGIPRRNVLTDTLEWFRGNLDLTRPKARAAFDQVRTALAYYRTLEGLNVNDSSRHDSDTPVTTLASIPRTPNNLPYFTADGTPSTGYVNFSIGGIHGAEFDLAAWEAEAELVRLRNADRLEVQRLHPDPLDLWSALPGAATITVNGREWSRGRLLTAATRKKDLVERREQLAALGDQATTDELAAWAERWEGIGFRALEAEPSVFVDLPDGSNRLHPRYAAASGGEVIHEDFTSYYPNLLMNLAAFDNPQLGTDRYAEIFRQKEDLGRQLKNPGADSADRARLKVLREGTKLVLNAASGAADAFRDNPIRMNNRILSMRIIGQLLTWRVGQAQTFAGATIISTNTDGLYSMGLDPVVNNRVLAEQAAAIGIEIEPEPIGVVSKDSNNRVEFGTHGHHDLASAPITAASGGSLAAFRGPTPKKSLAHPAVLDWALARYLREVLAGNADLGTPLDRSLGGRLIRAAAALDPFEACRLFQHVVVSSPSKRIIPFGIDLDTVVDDQVPNGDLVMLQHTSRVFFVRRQDGSAIQQLGLLAATSSTAGTDDQRLFQKARQVLFANNWSVEPRDGKQLLPPGHTPAVRKVTGISADWPVIVADHDLLHPPAGAPTPAQLVDLLDLDRYVDLLASTFESNWMNRPVPGRSPEDDAGEVPMVQPGLPPEPEVAA